MANPFHFSRFLHTANQFSPMALFSFLYHLPNLFRLSMRLLNDSRIPFHLKLLCYGSILYLLLPIDLLRDFPFFILGYSDDLLIIFLAFRKLIKDSPQEIVREHVQAISEGR